MPTKPPCRRETIYGYDPKDVIQLGRPGPPGKKGDQGPPGLNAYALALRNGFVGTEEEWLESLKGEPGTNGDGAVDSVNGLVGDVVLDADDVGADPAGTALAAAAASIATHVSNPDPHPQYNITKIDGGFF